MNANTELVGKAILVIGAARGIGAAVASALESPGVNVIVADIAAAPAVDAQPSLNTIHLDVRSAESVDAAFSGLERRFGGVDAVVNCAGVGVFKPVMELTNEEWDRVLSTNLTGAFLCVRAALRQMLRRGGGRIIHIGSIADHVALPSNGVYGVSKAGLRMLTQIINEDYKHKGVRATLISLGAVYTDIWRSCPEFSPADMLDVADVARVIVGILKEPPHIRIDHLVLLPSRDIVSALAGQVAMVTGASRGIGAAIAMRLAANGAAVALLGRDYQRLSSVAALIRSSGGSSHAITCDVSDRSRVSGAISDVESSAGPVSILVNNAGLGGPFLRTDEVSDEEWELLFATNIRSVFWFCRALLPGMSTRGFGRIINISSVLGLAVAARSSTYSATKHAIVGYTKSLAVEWGRNGITSNVICPGYVLTDMTAKHPEPVPSESRGIPAGRLGTPEDVADLVVMVARKDSAYVNGAVLTVDGGLTAACPAT